MNKFKTIEVKQNILGFNDENANILRSELNDKGVFLINLMSSPGSGKTTTLTKVLSKLKSKYRIGVMEADIDSDVDAKTISDIDIKVIQLHTGGMCHLDATMTRQGLDELGADNLDLVVLENIGNLVCPAEFDTGAQLDMMILSIPEGDDKPLKYPLMFTKCDLLIINKMDVLPYFNFDLKACEERAKKLNPNIKIVTISALKDEGIDNLCDVLSTFIDKK